MITILGNNPAELKIGDVYIDLGAIVTDNVNNNLGLYAVVDGVDVGNINNVSVDTSTSDEHTIVYYATDQAGNRGEATRTVIVGTLVTSESESTGTTTPPVEEEPAAPKDTTAPVVLLIGNATIELTVGDTYVDEGATAIDDTDGDITSNIIAAGTVDTTTAGLYTVTYNVADQAGNQANELIRTVNVSELAQEAIVDEVPAAIESASTTESEVI